MYCSNDEKIILQHDGTDGTVFYLTQKRGIQNVNSVNTMARITRFIFTERLCDG